MITVEEREYIEESGIRMITPKDNDYPESLRNIYDPPEKLYYKGDLKADDATAVAIVGARMCSAYGFQTAEKIAFELAQRGVTVISGMARGIDTAAHRGALKAQGRTVAIMGSGFRHIYPPESKNLISLILENGAVITEYESNVLPLKWNFPRRNRIISGMAKGVLVVEAARKSGAMLTVNSALEQGKDIFAIPGRIDSILSSGPNVLIQKGAKLVMSVDDILEEIDIAYKEKQINEDKDKALYELSKSDKLILDLLEQNGSIHIDRFLESGEIDKKILPDILLKLEFDGLIKALPGKNYVKV